MTSRCGFTFSYGMSAVDLSRPLLTREDRILKPKSRFPLSAMLVGTVLTACGGGSPSATSEPSFCEAYGAVLEGEEKVDEAAQDSVALRAAAMDQEIRVFALRSDPPAEIRDEVAGVVDLWDSILAIMERYDYETAKAIAQGTKAERSTFVKFGNARGPEDEPTRAVEDWVMSHCPSVDVPPPLIFSPVPGAGL